MIRYLYVLLDVLAETVTGQVLSFPSDAAAVRFFADVLADTKTLPGAHPDHFNLYRVGQMNDATGAIKALKVPTLVESGSAVKLRTSPGLTVSDFRQAMEAEK